MENIIAVVNQKGGVAKTTTAVNLSAAIALEDKEVLLVDMDPQGHTTSALGLDKYNYKNDIYHALMGFEPITNCIEPTELEFLKVVPANKNLVGAEIELIDRDAREFRLREILRPVAENYQYVLIDCPPSLGLLTINAMVAARQLLIPLQAEYLALEGVSELMDTVQRVQASLNPELAVKGVILTMVDDRTNLAGQVEDEVRAAFGDKVYKTVIPRNVRLAEAPSFGQPIMLYDITSKGAVAYLRFAREFTCDG